MSEENKYSFVKETVKDEQMTGRNLVKSVFRTITKGIVIGGTACLVFCGLKPWMETFFAPESTEVSIPKDEEEEVVLENQEEGKKLTAENYREMNEALKDVALEARKCIVEIRSIQNTEDWKEEEMQESLSGVIVWDNGVNVLILAPKGDFKKNSEVNIRFSNNTEYQGTLRNVDRNLEFGLFVLPKSRLDSATVRHMKVAELGNSYTITKGAPVIALGLQFGYSDGMGYGVVSSTKNMVTIADYKYPIITTDISASQKGSGVLFNIDGEVVGIIDQKHTDITEVNLVSAYAISELKEPIELLSNGKGVPYLGIRGIEVTEEISEKEGIPVGLYVKEVEAESPAMDAGVQCGDILVKMGDTDILTQKGYSNQLLQYSEATAISLEVMRLDAEEYKNIRIEAVVGVK